MSRVPNILLVEDDEIDVKLIQKAFDRLQLEVGLSVVNNGEEALAFLRSSGRFESVNPPEVDLIIMDINMPRMNGKELLGAIKGDPTLEKKVILVLSSSSSDGDINDCYRLGANGYIVKPETPQEIQASLRSVYEFWFSVAALPRG